MEDCEVLWIAYIVAYTFQKHKFLNFLLLAEPWLSRLCCCVYCVEFIEQTLLSEVNKSRVTALH